MSSVGQIRAVVDTSSLVPATLRRDLQQAAQLGRFTAIWSPWIIAELNRVLVWRWINSPSPTRVRGDLTRANERACSNAAKAMMQILLPTFELVAPLPPYPTPWTSLKDVWDHPIWAAAKISNAQHIISENTIDYPPLTAEGRHLYENVEFIGGKRFLALITEE